ncbi:hypothetical protein F511_15783 [Dorcoceras hygrometricum]|nr:hypothetical protein F511_15783 [Dorcoceras hygrometricum]
MGLNVSSIRSQILMMRKLPFVSQEFAIVKSGRINRTTLTNQSIMEVPTTAFYSSSIKKNMILLDVRTVTLWDTQRKFATS